MMMVSFIFYFILFFACSSQTVVAGVENPLVELSSREELTNIAGYGEAKLSTVLVTGTLLCEEAKCDLGETQLNSHPISGVEVAVSCHLCRKTRELNLVRSTTDVDGDFVMDLPSHIHGIPNLEKVCRVKVVNLRKTSPRFLSFPTNKKHHQMTLLSAGHGTRIYTTKTIRMRTKTLKDNCTEYI